MMSIRGIYENGQIKLLEALPKSLRAEVIVTLLEDLPAKVPETPSAPIEPGWLGTLRHTARILGDIVQPLDDAGAMWEALQA